MPVQALISVGEYLRSSYDYDMDYVDGELIERGIPTRNHARLQGAICAFLFERRKTWHLEVDPDVRVQVSEKKYRVVDLCAVPDTLPDSDVIREPPIFIIEILSPDDSMSISNAS